MLMVNVVDADLPSVTATRVPALSRIAVSPTFDRDGFRFLCHVYIFCEQSGVFSAVKLASSVSVSVVVK